MKKIKIEKEYEIDVKRFYLPISHTVNCAHCGKELEKEFEWDYLSYPILNASIPVGIYCNDCEKESEFDIKLCLSVEIEDEVRKI